MTLRLLTSATARRLLAAALLAAPAAAMLAPADALAQTAGGAATAPVRRWTAVRVAKWALRGAATGFGLYALSHSRRADRSYDDLRTLCVRSPGSCALDSGRYVGAEAEALYRGSVREDRRAQLGIVGGQLTLLGSVALFVYDLRNDRGPENIPSPGGALRRGAGALAGITLGATVRF